MKNLPKRTVHPITTKIASVFVLVLISSVNCFAVDLNSSLHDFLANNFPNNHFIATPYGADSRYSVRTIWVQLSNVQKTGSSTDKVKAWVALSDGLSVYPDSSVKIRQEPINVRGFQMDRGTKWAFAAALSGKIEGVPVDAGFDFGHTNDLDVDIDLGEVEVEYSYYADLLLSQKIYQQNLDALLDLVKGKDNELPPLRVIATALRVRNANVTVKNKSGTTAGLEAKVAQFLTNFGLHYNAQKDTFESLQVGDWKYIAFEALLADKKTGKVSTAVDISEDVAVTSSLNSRIATSQLGIFQP